MKSPAPHAKMHKIHQVFSSVLVLLLPLMSAKADIGYELITIGNPGNSSDSTGYGRVDYYYRIGKYEVKIAQYAAFLNAVAVTDTYGLYNPSMASDTSIAGIARSGSQGSYAYTVIGDGNRPISYVSWFDAARMANWMHNGQSTGVQDASTTESGAYALAGATSGIINKTGGALIYIPTENEWFKAAYYDSTLNSGSGGYWLYPTRSNNTPGNVVGAMSNQCNYYTASFGPDGLFSVTQRSTFEANLSYITPVGAYINSASAYGTFDQAGNVYEFTDTLISSAPFRRGGCWPPNNSGATLQLSKNGRSQITVTDENGVMGFRLAAVAKPEIIVEHPSGNNLTDGGAALTLGNVMIGSNPVLTITIRNIGTSPLSGLSISSDGNNSEDYIIGSLGTTALNAGQTATFTVTYTPISNTSGLRSAAIHIASNDIDENPFDITVTANAFSPTADFDQDGLNDWAEHKLAALGFDWQLNQPSLVTALNNGANAAGLYTGAQIQTINVGVPLLTRDAGGNCKLTISLQKSLTLANGFAPLPFLAPQILVNAQGQLEFTFAAPENTAFFRVEAR